MVSTRIFQLRKCNGLFRLLNMLFTPVDNLRYNQCIFRTSNAVFQSYMFRRIAAVTASRLNVVFKKATAFMNFIFCATLPPLPVFSLLLQSVYVYKGK